jgi:hypothetical protein
MHSTDTDWRINTHNANRDLDIIYIILQGGGTGRWLTTTFAMITDGYFGRRCASKVGAADIVLSAAAAAGTAGAGGGAGIDMIVHGLEIYDPSKLPARPPVSL